VQARDEAELAANPGAELVYQSSHAVSNPEREGITRKVVVAVQPAWGFLRLSEKVL
jgi:hypothetical protein